MGLPARNEASHVVAALEALRVAADAMPDGVTARIVVACDSCTDGTASLAARLAAVDDRIVVVNGSWRSAGAARRAAIDRGLRELRRQGIELDACWIAASDADTVVPPEWLTMQVGYSDAGIDAVAGIVELRDDADLSDRVAYVFDRTYTTDDTGHGHVHGANLGVRATAYLAVGGFPPLAVAEDHALWTALRSAGFKCLASLGLQVATSARLEGRAPGGFADTLRHRLDLHGDVGMPVPAGQSA